MTLRQQNRRVRIMVAAFLCGVAVVMNSGCGYRMASDTAMGIPASIKTIAVPSFVNETFQYKIEQRLTEAVTREFMSRTAYRIQTETEGSDAVMRGAVTSIYSTPIVFDPSSGRTSRVLITVGMRVIIEDTRTGQRILEANDLLFRETYEVSGDPSEYFEEDQPALERLSRHVASSLVSTVLRGF